MDFLIDLWSFALRSVLAVLALFVISRIEGPRQISQLTFYDYIVGISIGSIAATAVEREISLWDMVVSMIIFGGFAFLISFSTSKSMVLRRLFSGKPSILVYNGKIIESQMKKNHYDVNDLMLNCRAKGYFKFEDIAFAILESNGELSIMPKADKAPLTPYDMSVKPQKEELEYNLIIDGTILFENLKYYGKDEQWLKTKLVEQKVKNESEVLLAIGDSNNNLTVYLKSEVLPHNHFFM